LLNELFIKDVFQGGGQNVCMRKMKTNEERRPRGGGGGGGRSQTNAARHPL
jgi:hypothetical protein